MKYSIEDYTIISNNCKNLQDIEKVKEIFKEEQENYTRFEKQVILNRINRRIDLLKNK